MKCRAMLVISVIGVFLANAVWAADYLKAVYYDTSRPQGWMGVVPRDTIYTYFVEQGYEELDATAVREWMQARIADKTPSVIVMSQDIYPSTIVELDENDVPVKGTTLRQYLDAGGKVIHLADIPMWNVSNDDYVTVNPQGNGAVQTLGFDTTDRWDANVEVTITEEGEKWGLTQVWQSLRAILPSKVDVVLATSEDGAYASGWVRRFALMPSSGFVRLWDRNLDPDGENLATQEVLEDIQRVAEYGMDQVTGIGTITGAVKDSAGQALSGIQVRLTASWGSATIVTDAQGAFTISAAEGSVTGEASGKHLASGREITSSDTPAVTVEAGKTVNMTITVQTKDPYVYNIVRAKSPIVIDGNDSDAAWADAVPMVIDQPSQVNNGTVAGNDDLSGVLRYLFDDEYFYVYADITDDMPRLNTNTDGNVWQGDGIESYVGLDAYDPNRTAYDVTRNFQWTIGVGPEPQWKIFRNPVGDALPPEIPELEGNFVVKDKAAPAKPGYIIEARMPWTGFPEADPDLIPPKDNTPAHITAALNDNDDPEGTTRQKGMIFEVTTDAWQNPSTWVRAIWNGPVAPPPPPGVKGDVDGNGQLAILDVVAALRIVAGLAEATPDNLAGGDLNGNGRIEITEVVQILRAVAGLGTL